MGFKLAGLGGQEQAFQGAFIDQLLQIQFTGNANNFAPSYGNVTFENMNALVLDCKGAFTMTGLRGGRDGRVVRIMNVGAGTLTLAANDAGSDAENRFASAVALTTNSGVTLEYSAAANRWIIVGANAGASFDGFANPTAQVGPAAVNGVATTAMRSDAAPALANTTVVAGAYTAANITVDAQGRLTAAANGAAAPAGANPTGTVGLATVNGAAATFLRSDGAPPLSQAINPTWTAQHVFNPSGVIPIVINGDVATALHATQNVNSPVTVQASNTNNGASAFSRFHSQTLGAAAAGAFMSQANATNTWYQGVVTQDASAYQIALNGTPSSNMAICAMRFDSARALRLPAYGAGNLASDASGNITSTSDARIKRNVRPYNRGLAEVLQLNPVLFGYTLESGLDQTRDDYASLLAQDVERIAPEAVGRMSPVKAIRPNARGLAKREQYAADQVAYNQTIEGIEAAVNEGCRNIRQAVAGLTAARKDLADQLDACRSLVFEGEGAEAAKAARDAQTIELLSAITGHDNEIVALRHQECLLVADGKRQVAELAQPIEPHLGEDDHDIEIDADPLRTLNKDALLMMALNAIKELSAKIAVLEGKV